MHVEKGFDFLGQNVRRYSNGQLLIKPSKKNVKTFLGGISNSGTVSVTAVGAAATSVGIYAESVSLYQGGLTNTGLIKLVSAQGFSGIEIGDVGTFVGNVIRASRKAVNDCDGLAQRRGQKQRRDREVFIMAHSHAKV